MDYSFKKLSEKGGIHIYYTNPAKAKLGADTATVIAHYDAALKQIGNKKWVWIFDSDGFDTKQAFEVKTGVEIMKLITTKYGDTLQEIKIINPTWHIKAVLTALSPFLNDSVKQRLIMMKDRYYSVIEFI
jgi:hypothetical protein